MTGVWVKLAEAWEKLAAAFRRLFHRPTRNEGGYVKVGRSDAAARVERGAALLDRKRPGWEKQVQAGSVQVESMFLCVLGQTYGHYRMGAAALGLDLHAAVAHGFNSSDPILWRDFGELNEEWRTLITARQAALV